MHRTRSVIMASVILVLGFSSFAVARTGEPLLEGKRNGTATAETSIIAKVDGTAAATGGYSTRQSNTSTTGGGAVYGCRSTTAANAKPCIRANNLSSGRSFEFNATAAPVGGTITVGPGGDTKKPFTTNATGVADGLNADRVDGQSADQIVAASRATAGLNAATVGGTTPGQLRTRWVLVNALGEIEAQSGGFTVVTAYPGATATPVGGAAGNVYIQAGENLTDNGIQATIALQNRVDQNGDAITNGSAPDEDSNPEFGGEISASRCATTPNTFAVNCAPTNTNSESVFVVSPRNSDGTRTTPDTRKRFYVTITE